jgi:hypothetical protein
MSGRFMMRSRMRSNHVCTMKNLNRRSRKLHRLVVPIAAIPLALTALSGAIYGTVLAMNIDAPWLLRLHTGNFGIVNLTVDRGDDFGSDCLGDRLAGWRPQNPQLDSKLKEPLCLQS